MYLVVLSVKKQGDCGWLQSIECLTLTINTKVCINTALKLENHDFHKTNVCDSQVQSLLTILCKRSYRRVELEIGSS